MLSVSFFDAYLILFPLRVATAILALVNILLSLICGSFDRCLSCALFGVLLIVLLGSVLTMRISKLEEFLLDFDPGLIMFIVSIVTEVHHSEFVDKFVCFFAWTGNNSSNA